MRLINRTTGCRDDIDAGEKTLRGDEVEEEEAAGGSRREQEEEEGGGRRMLKEGDGNGQGQGGGESDAWIPLYCLQGHGQEHGLRLNGHTASG